MSGTRFQKRTFNKKQAYSPVGIIIKKNNMIEKIKDMLKSNNNTLKIKGRVKLECHNANGKLQWSTGWMNNTIANSGLGVVSGLVGNVGSEVAFTYLAVGTDSTAESAAHTALQAEIVDTGLARAAATVTQETTTQTDDTLQLYKVWTATGTKSIEEIGAFNDATTGTMLGRKLTGTKTVNNTETLTATYQFIFS
jgi:hypothetical protein